MADRESPIDWYCAQCYFMAADANTLDGHVRNVHGWPTPPGVHTLPAKRCEYALPGLGRCVDSSGVVHGHHFKPGQLDPALVLTPEEARQLVEYLGGEDMPDVPDAVYQLWLRIRTHLRVTA